VNYQKPFAIEQYCLFAHGVDRSNQNVSYYQYERKSCRWHKKVFFYLVEVCITNAHILHQKLCKANTIVPLKLEEFRIKLVENMVKRYSTERGEMMNRPITIEFRGDMAKGRRLIDRHFLEEIPKEPGSKDQRKDCVYCSDRSNDANKKSRQKTKYRCQQCQVPLCPTSCFKVYHTRAETSL